MARFDNPNMGLPNAPNFLGLSQGTDRARGSEAFGDLFKGVGQVVANGITTVDETNQRNIENELYAGIDAIRGGQGVDTAVVAANTPALIPDEGNSNTGGSGAGAKTPPAIDSATNEIGRLQKAYTDGKIGDTQYWAKVESLVRQVRSRYPGYREEIDKKVSSITGTTPANALRKSMLDEFEAAQKTARSRSDDAEKHIRNNAKYLSPSSRDSFFAGQRDPVSLAKYTKEIADGEANDKMVQSQKNRIELLEAEGKLEVNDAKGVLTSDLNQKVAAAMNSGFDRAGVASGTQVMAKIQEIALRSASGKGGPKPEEIEMLRGQFATIKASITSMLDQTISAPGVTGGKSYAAMIKDPAAIKAIKEQALAPIANIEQALINGDFGTLAIDANTTKAMQNHDQRKILESSDAARKINAARALGGETAMGVFLNSSTGLTQLNEFAQTLTRMQLSKTMLGEGTLMDQFNELVNVSRGPNGQGKVNPKQLNALLDGSVQVLTGKSQMDTVKNAATVIFQKGSTDELRMFVNPNQQARVFAKFTSPEVTASMLELKKTNPELWTAYTRWAGSNFESINNQLITDIAGIGRSGMGVSIAADASGKLRVVDMAGTGRATDTSQNPIAVAARQRELEQANARLQNFNLGVDTLTPIFKAEGIDIKQALAPLYKKMGLQVGEDKESGNSGSPKGDQQGLNPNSLGNQVQLASFTTEDNTVPGRRDEAPLDLDAEAVKAVPGGLDLDASYGPLDEATGQGLASGTYAPVLNLIGRAEAPRGYNQIFGRGREAPLTQMTISEVFDLQRRMVRGGSESSAVGRYQFINDTLRSVVKKAGLDPETTQFTPEVQDRLATMLMVGRGLNRYLRGEIDEERFANNLAQEWAGFPLASGRSFYKGVGSNNATITRRDLINTIRSLKNEAR